jgi:hypothetical protein
VLLPEYSAAVIGRSVVLRVYTGGIFSVSLAFTTVPFATPDEARAWVEANKTDVSSRLYPGWLRLRDVAGRYWTEAG